MASFLRPGRGKSIASEPFIVDAPSPIPLMRPFTQEADLLRRSFAHSNLAILYFIIALGLGDNRNSHRLGHSFTYNNLAILCSIIQ
jgi:hypothetical protein